MTTESQSTGQRKAIATIYWALAGTCLPLGFSHVLGALGLIGLAMFLYGFLRDKTRITVGVTVALTLGAWLFWAQQRFSLTGSAWWLTSAAVILVGVGIGLGLERVWKLAGER